MANKFSDFSGVLPLYEPFPCNIPLHFKHDHDDALSNFIPLIKESKTLCPVFCFFFSFLDKIFFLEKRSRIVDITLYFIFFFTYFYLYRVFILPVVSVIFFLTFLCYVCVFVLDWYIL